MLTCEEKTAAFFSVFVSFVPSLSWQLIVYHVERKEKSRKEGRFRTCAVSSFQLQGISELQSATP